MIWKRNAYLAALSKHFQLVSAYLGLWITPTIKNSRMANMNLVKTEKQRTRFWASTSHSFLTCLSS